MLTFREAKDIKYYPEYTYMKGDIPQYRVNEAIYLASHVDNKGGENVIKHILTDSIHSCVVFHIEDKFVSDSYDYEKQIVEKLNSGELEMD